MNEVTPERLQRVTAALSAKAARARDSLEDFFGFVMKVERTGRPLVIRDHQRVFIDFIEHHPRCLVRGFAGCTKTYIMAARAMWLLGKDPSERGFIVSATQAQSKKPMAMVRQYLESSPELRLVFPHLRPSERPGDPWTQTALAVQRESIIRDPSLAALHLGAKVSGSRISFANPDDLLTQQNQSSEAQRDLMWEWFWSTLMNRLDADGGECVVTNTPWYPNDFTYDLEKGRDGVKPFPSLTLDAEGDILIRNTDWDSPLIRPAMTRDPEGVRHRLIAHDSPDYARQCGIDTNDPTWVDERDQVPLWPDPDDEAAWTSERLAREKSTTTILEYNRSKRCNPQDPEKQRIKQEHIDACKAAAVRYGAEHLVHTLVSDANFTGVDPAFGLKKNNDRSAIFTFGALPSGHRRILEIQVGRWPSGELVQRTVDAAIRYGSVVCVEGNAAQRMVRDWAMQQRAEVIIRARDTTAKNKSDPKFGVEQLLMEIQQAMWLFPHDPRTGHFTDEGMLQLIQDLMSYRPGLHTGDVLMAMWIAREQARRMGVLEMDLGGGPGRVGFR